jgi:dTDP-4-amino-4,6-dideoxygalactose transaminase
LYIFRLEAAELGISRARFLEALEAEGVPASEGWYRPLYRNGVFANAHVGPPHGIRSPLAGMGVDYRDVSCPVCEKICGDAVWIPQEVLLADEAQILRLAEAIRKVIANAPALRQNG